jgi:hypothetical protein
VQRVFRISLQNMGYDRGNSNILDINSPLPHNTKKDHKLYKNDTNIKNEI